MESLKQKPFELLGKPVAVVHTDGFDSQYGGIEGTYYLNVMKCVLTKDPVDMYVWEVIDGDMVITSAGYGLTEETKGELIEGPEVARLEGSMPTEKFWVKIDDYGDKYVMTFLFPHEW